MENKTCYISVLYLGYRRVYQKTIGEEYEYSLYSKDKFSHQQNFKITTLKQA